MANPTQFFFWGEGEERLYSCKIPSKSKIINGPQRADSLLDLVDEQTGQVSVEEEEVEGFLQRHARFKHVPGHGDAHSSAQPRLLSCRRQVFEQNHSEKVSQ